MPEIQWTKTYDLKIDSCNFHVVVSEHVSGFYASCLWYEKEEHAPKASGEFGSLQFYLEQRFATSEQEALFLSEKWVNNKFGTNGSLQRVNSN